MASIAQTTTAQTNEIKANKFLSGLAFENGSNFQVWSDTNLTFDLNINQKPPGESKGNWTDGLSAAIAKAIKDVEAVCGIDFTEVNSSNADVEFWAYKENGGALGYSYLVDGPGVFINMAETVGNPEKFKYGSYDYITVIHELLHNLGLAHAHPDGSIDYQAFPGVSSSNDLGTHKLNQNIYTVMSYNDFGSSNSGLKSASGVETTGWDGIDHGYSVLGAFDIAMLQALYGEKASKANGDTVYNLPSQNKVGTYYKAIWDTGGTDTFKYRGSDKVNIDLRAATLDLSDGEAAGGMISKADGIYGGYTIANGVVIENAIGGSGNDTLVGNSAKNVLRGNNGNDKLLGLSGKDKLIGGNGKDKLIAGSGDDTIIGGKGDDTLTGGGGLDKFVFKKNQDSNVVKDFEDGADLINFKAFNFVQANGALSKFKNSGSSDVIFEHNGTEILFEDVRKSDLSAADFIL